MSEENIRKLRSLTGKKIQICKMAYHMQNKDFSKALAFLQGQEISTPAEVGR